MYRVFNSCFMRSRPNEPSCSNLFVSGWLISVTYVIITMYIYISKYLIYIWYYRCIHILYHMYSPSMHILHVCIFSVYAYSPCIRILRVCGYSYPRTAHDVLLSSCLISISYFSILMYNFLKYIVNNINTFIFCLHLGTKLRDLGSSPRPQ